MKKIILHILILTLLVSFVSAVEYIDSCQTLNLPNTKYFLERDITGIITSKCIEITGDNITLDCRGHKIISQGRTRYIYVTAENVTVKNCHIESLTPQPEKLTIFYWGVEYEDSAHNGVFENNTVINFFRGVFIRGDNSVIIDNYLIHNRIGLSTYTSENSILKQNYISEGIGDNSNPAYGFDIHSGKNIFLINNKDMVGSQALYTKDLTMNCGYYKKLKMDHYVDRVTAIGTEFEYLPMDADFTYIEDDCLGLDCIWVDDVCYKDVSNENCVDADGDGYPEFSLDCYDGRDCNDADAQINPGAEELCWNDVDENCDKKIKNCVEIDSCGTYNGDKVNYFLTNDILNINPMCLIFNGNLVELDCQNHLLETDVNLVGKHTPLIYSVGNYNEIRNCKVTSNHTGQGYDNTYGNGAITLIGSYGVIENNYLNSVQSGIRTRGRYNIINKNKIINCVSRGIWTRYGYNIIKNNLMKNCRIGLDADYDKFSLIENNYVYGGDTGVTIDRNSDGSRLKCGKYVNNSKIDISTGINIKAYGTIFNTGGSRINFIEYDCSMVDCIWVGDECLIDVDSDGVLNKDDECPDTILPEVIDDLLPNHYADIDGDSIFEKGYLNDGSNDYLNDGSGDYIISDYTLEDTFGCSCTQIMELKPGIDNIENGCSAGLLNVFIEEIGWARKLFD